MAQDVQGGESAASYIERTKLLATFLNNSGVALVSVGAAGPVVAKATGFAPTLASQPWGSIALLALFWILSAVALHSAGATVLRRLP